MALAGIGIVKDQPIDGTILVLNSGSSSLKFAVYSLDASVEEPLLAGSATGIGRTDGKLEVRTAGSKTLIHRESIHESQSEALAAIAAAMRGPHSDKAGDSGASHRPWWAEVAITSGDQRERVD